MDTNGIDEILPILISFFQIDFSVEVLRGIVRGIAQNVEGFF